MTHVLDNPVWHALSGAHRAFAARHGLALHYPREVAAFSAIAEASAQAYADLACGLPPDTDGGQREGPSIVALGPCDRDACCKAFTT